MKVVVAIDSFKGSLSSLEAGAAIREGIHRSNPGANVVIRPLADGGEGTVEALVQGMHGQVEEISVTGPLGKSVTARYGIILERKLAVIEMAAAAGITLVDAKERNPLHTTTYGVGEMIRDAIQKGCEDFIIGIGGSATNDGGVGMLQALGYDFLDKEGNQVTFGAAGVKEIASIKNDHVIPELWKCRFRIACDVTNPLCGENGCSAIYGPQKGATPEMVKEMDQWLASYAEKTKCISASADPDFPGAGAAGGLGFAFLSYTNAELMPGIQIVMEETGLEGEIKDADVVVTGEGRLDHQTAMGKAPVGVAKLGKKYRKMVLAFSGAVTRDARECNENGIDAYFPILREIVSLEEAMKPEMAAANLADTAEQVFRLIGRTGEQV